MANKHCLFEFRFCLHEKVTPGRLGIPLRNSLVKLLVY